MFWEGLKSQSLMDKEETVVMVRDDLEGQSRAAANDGDTARRPHHSQGEDGDS